MNELTFTLTRSQALTLLRAATTVPYEEQGEVMRDAAQVLIRALAKDGVYDPQMIETYATKIRGAALAATHLIRWQRSGQTETAQAGRERGLTDGEARISTLLLPRV